MSFRCILTLASLATLAAQQPADLREAARLDNAGRCDEAEKIYRRALAQGSPKPALLNNTGNHYLACGQPKVALEYFERLVSVQPLHMNGNLQLARLAMSAGQFSRAEELLQKVSAARPGEFEVLFLLGQASARAGNLPRARETLEAALRLRPDDLDTAVACGLANAAVGDPARAVFLLARAQAKAPDRPAIALALARAAEDAGYYGDALLAYDRYLVLRPDDGPVRRDRARSLALTVDGREKGVQELRKYVSENPRDALGHFYLAQLRWRDDADGSLSSLAEALRIDPKLDAAHLARAWLLHRMGSDTEALTHLEAVVRQAPTNVRALDQLGLVLLSLDRGAEAEGALRKAAELAPGDADVALHLGRALMQAGKEEEGQRWLEKWQSIRPSRQRDARRQSGMIELATLDPAAQRAREIERFRSMARSRPDDPLLQMHLAGLLLADGQTDEALREYQTLSSMNADASVQTQAGKALFRAGQPEAARSFFERAGSRLELAEVLLLTKASAEAMATLDRIPAAGHTVEYKLLRARVLDAAGRAEESERCLADVLGNGPLQPEAGGHAGLLWAKHGRYREAMGVLAQAMRAAPADPELRLTEAIVLALSGDTNAALERLRKIESSWPEWDRPWVAHGLVLRGIRRTTDAESKFRAAAALGSRENPASCSSLRAWVFDTCGK